MPSSNNHFSDSTSIDSGVDDLQNPKFNYAGHFDKQGFRDKYGCQNWDWPFRHKYAGYFLYNNMHGKGFYFIKHEDGPSFYDGQFFNNKLEGYGQVIYKNGDVHEGLFKDNRKFGPGVVSYTNGTQDVGLWNGNYLIRLSLSMSSDIVPSLCYNSANKIKLLRFRKIVPALSEKQDMAKELMSELTEDDYFTRKYPELYNPHVRNENSLFFDRRYYDLTQLGSEDTLIEVVEDDGFVDTISELTMSEDSPCPCIDERCVHVTKQLSELDTVLKDIQEKRRKYEKQLEICETCCKFRPSPFMNPSGSNSNNSISTKSNSSYEGLKNSAKSSIVDDDAPTSKERNEQLRQESSFAQDVILSGGKVSGNLEFEATGGMYQSQKNITSIDRIFVNPKQFHSDLSINNSDQDKFPDDAIENYTCKCMDEELPNVDFLLEQLKKLRTQEKFYYTVIEFLNKVMYKEFSTLHKSNSSKVIKLPVEDLLSWNNGKTAIEILQHTFRYRNFEKILSFSIKSLLIGERNAFGKMGSVETTCLKFLKHCIRNDIDEVRRDLFCHNVYPDLSDARGNTGLHLSVSYDRHEIIRQLANVGANLDAFNDECLTPLVLSLLRYIAALNRVVLWDKAFLSELMLNSKELNEVTQWRPHESLVSLGEFVGSSLSYIPTSDHHNISAEAKKSSAEMITKIRSHLQSIKSGSISSRINLDYLFSTSFVEDYEKHKKQLAAKKVDEVEEKEIDHIARTIEILIHYGADPNIGDLPMKPVLLAIFSKNVKLVEKLLHHAANPNSVTEENLTGLHILSSLPFSSKNVQMAEMFLGYSSDPNKKTFNDFWIEQNEELIGSYVNHSADTEDYEGKTPLQMAVMRKDFDDDNFVHQCDLVKVLIEYGGSFDQYYLGHTLLSMAVLRGNEKLIRTLQRYVELEQPLGENMGNALTLLGLQRFPSVGPFMNCKSTIDALISFGMNPFNPVYDFANIFEFFLRDYSVDLAYDIPRVRTNIETTDCSLRKIIQSNIYNSNKDCNKLSIAYLKEIGRGILMTRYQLRAIQVLLLFAAEDLLYHKCLDNMAKFFTIQEAIDCLKYHIRQNNVILDASYEENILRVLNFIKSKLEKAKDSKRNQQKKQASLPMPPSFFEGEIVNLRGKFEVPNYIIMYASDDNQGKYEVCFHCLRRFTRKLSCCPCCGSVKFCSEMCNKYNNKLPENKHTCNILFYDEMKRIFDKPCDSSGMDSLMLEAKQTREEAHQAELLRRKNEEEENLRKLLRKSQRMDSHLKLAASRSRSFLEKATSISSSQKRTSKKLTICCKPPSSIFVCDNTHLKEQRKLNCGFHCGHIIPDVVIDDKGEIIREKEFCECYPLYKSEPPRKIEVQEADDTCTTHYSLSDVFGGALTGEQRDVEELDKLIGTFTKECKQEISKKEGKLEKIDSESEIFKTEQEYTETSKTKKHKEGGHSNIKLKSEAEMGESKGKEQELGRQIKKGEHVETGIDHGKKKVGEETKIREKVESETELIEKSRRKKKDKKSKFRSKSESSLLADGVKKKKKEKVDKGVGDSGKLDKKTMTKKSKDKKKEKKRQKGIQVETKSEKKKDKSRKAKEKRSPAKKKVKGGRKKTTDKVSKKKDHKRIQKTKTSGKVSPKERYIDKEKIDATMKPMTSFKIPDSNMLPSQKILAGDYKRFKKISRVYQYFLELIATYFPDFDVSCLVLPFACFIDGQLYYKFTDALPYYCRTYSTI